MVAADLTSLSKATAHALRHEPWLYELELDEEGWVPVDSLIGALRHERRWRDLSRAQIESMVGQSPKKRYELDGDRIRALYGHSVPGRIAKQPGSPPAVLFHGTAAGTVPVILADGLRPMGRQYVHLSVERDMAVSVGRRKGADVTILRIRAAEAHAGGVTFWRGNDLVWLADHVPPGYIQPE